VIVPRLSAVRTDMPIRALFPGSPGISGRCGAMQLCRPILLKFFACSLGGLFIIWIAAKMMPRCPSLTKRSAIYSSQCLCFQRARDIGHHGTTTWTPKSTTSSATHSTHSAPNGAGGVAVVARSAAATCFQLWICRPGGNDDRHLDSLFNVGSVRKIFEAAGSTRKRCCGAAKLDEPCEIPSPNCTRLHPANHIANCRHTSGLLLADGSFALPEQHFSLAGFTTR